ncbi:MAG TPA: phosphate-starvation-inducible PsiE family protein [Rubrobacteraceae bacterium]|nr:phosphate-starvation-inducible PsiE family protein [Rubrobacteraceae bacterium]
MSDKSTGREGKEAPVKELRLAEILGFSERVVYYVAAVALLVTVGMLFVSAGDSILRVPEVGPLETALEVLDRVLLIFIFAELLGTISTIVREREVKAEPFLLIGLIAVVRRILGVTVSIEQSLGTPEFTSLLLELGVLTGLVLTLTIALYFTRRMEGRRESPR